MYNVIYLGVFRFINMGFATIFITLPTYITVECALNKPLETIKHFYLIVFKK